MLVLTHANRFGIDLDQLRQRVLKTPRNAGRPAQTHVHIGHFLAGIFAGTVDRGTGLTHHHFVDDLAGIVFGQPFDQLARQFVGFTAGRSVANGNQVNAVFFAQKRQGVQGAVPVFARLMRINSGRLYQLSGGINHGDFDARANAGV